MIKLISGACRVGSKLMRPADKPFSLTEKEEAYLVEQGVAKYVTEEAPTEKVATPLRVRSSLPQVLTRLMAKPAQRATRAATVIPPL